MRGRPIAYSSAEVAWLASNSRMVLTEYHREFCRLFDRGDVSASNLNALRKRRGWATGRTGRFEKGVAPVNKGKQCPPGTGGRHPNARRTHFRKGSRNGKAALNYKPIGTERVSKDGYRERKIHDGLPLRSRWKALHRIEWEAVHGPVPAGMVLKCLGAKDNPDPSNWVLVPRALLPRLNGRFGRAFDEAPDQLKPVLLAVSELEHLLRSRRMSRAPAMPIRAASPARQGGEG